MHFECSLKVAAIWLDSLGAKQVNNSHCCLHSILSLLRSSINAVDIVYAIHFLSVDGTMDFSIITVTRGSFELLFTW